jgi:ABC-type transport system substrate-binding protein
MKCCRVLSALLFSLLLLLLPLGADAQTVRIAVPEIPFSSDLFANSSPIGMVLRNAVGGVLVEKSGGVRTRFSDAISTSHGGEKWSFRIRPGVLLHSGRPLIEADVLYSLRRCHPLVESGMIAQLSKGYHTAQNGSVLRFGERWVTVEIRDGGAAADGDRLLELLSKCQLYDRIVHPGFADHTGIGTNFASVGAYEVITFRPSRRLTLKRRLVYREDHRTGPAEVVLTVSRSDIDSLGALRSGSIDLFFTENQGVIAEAEKDETLRVLQCSIYTVVYRNGLRSICQPDLEIALLEYR